MRDIDRARNDSRVRALLAEIQRHVQIKYERSDRDGWTSNMEGNTAYIGFTECQHPSAALAHELLHITTQLQGYRRMRISFAASERAPRVKRLLDCLDNELQHHKFYPKFLSLQFRPNQFYGDSDLNTEKWLLEAGERLHENAMDIFPDWFTALAPGGSIGDDAKAHIREIFLANTDGRFRQQLLDVEAVVREWQLSPLYDAAPTVKRIFLIAEPVDNLTWIGFEVNDRPPEKGFFVDKKFEVRN